MKDYSNIMPAEVRTYHLINENRKKNKEAIVNNVRSTDYNYNIFDKGNNKTETTTNLNDTINQAIEEDLTTGQDYKTVDDVINAKDPELLQGDKAKTDTEAKPAEDAKKDASPAAAPANGDSVNQINQIIDARIKSLEDKKNSGGKGRKDRCKDDINKLNSFKDKWNAADKNNAALVDQLQQELLSMGFNQEGFSDENKQQLGTLFDSVC